MRAVIEVFFKPVKALTHAPPGARVVCAGGSSLVKCLDLIVCMYALVVVGMRERLYI